MCEGCGLPPGGAGTSVMGQRAIGRRGLLAGLGVGGLAALVGGRVAQAAPAPLAAPSRLTAPPALLTGSPVIRPRSDWAGTSCPPTGPLPVELPGDVRFLLVHHTAEPGNDYVAGDVPGLLRGMYAFHTGPAKGWSDLAYNFLVDRYGGIWEGRTGSLTSPVVPSATGGTQGYDQLGCFLGDHAVVPPTPEAQASMISLLAWLAGRYGVDTTPGTTVTFVSRGSNRWPAGTPVTTATIEGHRAMSLTTCPGDAAYPLVKDVFPAAVTRLVRPVGAIEQHYLELGGPSSFLGPARTRELAAPDGVGRHVEYRGGAIWWSPATGAHEVHGQIRSRWARLRGVLGYPTTDELGTPGGGARFNHFERGSVYWSPATGAHEVHGDIRAAWAAGGWEAGPLGLPTTDELACPDGRGRRQDFQAGGVWWTPTTGAHEVHGRILQAWVARGAERGQAGYPVSDEQAVAGGRASDFEHQTATWSASTDEVVFTPR